jgi:hypothetical protein
LTHHFDRAETIKKSLSSSRALQAP